VETDWGGRCAATPAGLRGIHEGLPRILATLKHAGCRGTFFVSAALAEKQKDIVPWLASEGHEIASHGYDHHSYAGLDRDELVYQLAKSKALLEAQAGRSVVGFRAPQFRISPLLFDTLRAQGYRYDSSVVLGRLTGRYDNGRERLAQARQAGIIELPIRKLPLLRFPFGLLWVNAVGLGLIRPLLGRKKMDDGVPDWMLYCHPFDLLASKRGGQEFPLAVRLWYAWRARAAARTFDDLISFISQR
jgi:hypothetical protein